MLKKPFTYIRDYAHLAVWDWTQNYRFAKAPRRFLVITHPSYQPLFYDVFLHWTQAHFPELRKLFELRPIPVLILDWSRYILHIPWLQDPVQEWSTATYHQANHLAALCDQHSIPVINRVAGLIHSSKSAGARLMSEAGTGFIIPKSVPVTNLQEFKNNGLGLSFPLLVREDCRHQSLIERADNLSQCSKLDLNAFTRPVAAEIINTQSADGYYRKYRYIIAGNTGVPLSMHMSKDWICRGENSIYNKHMFSEEMAYTQTVNPHHEKFLALTKALKLDFAAFDYSLDQEGKLVVWEANPFPFLHFPGGGVVRRDYGGQAMSRVFAAMIQLYFQKAGLKVPADIEYLIKLPA